jgi:hypothetical protein
MEQPTRKLIRHDGTEIDCGKLTIGEVEKLIGADYLDTVNLRGKHGSVMLLDNLGHDKALPVNQTYTHQYVREAK